MATNKKVVRKNGIPVKKFWRDKVKRTDSSYPTTYPVYWTSSHDQATFNKVWSLTDEKAPRTLEDALERAELLVRDEGGPQTHAVVYELRPLYRVGTEFDWKAYQNQQSYEERTPHGPTFRLLHSTASPSSTSVFDPGKP